MAVSSGDITAEPQLRPETLSVGVFQGGGSLGLISAHMADAYEQRSGEPLHTNFDQMHGTSIGALNASLLWPLETTGKPLMSAEELRGMFHENIDAVFDENWTSIGGLRSSKYDNRHLGDVLENLLGDLKLSDFQDGLNVHVFDLTEQREIALSSDDAKKDPSKDFLMKDLLIAATAAPLIFEQGTITNIAGEEKNYTDAGVYAADPSFVTYMRLLQQGIPTENIVLTSFGTGTERGLEMVPEELNDGIIGSAKEALGAVFLGATKTNETLMHDAMGDRYILLDIDITGDDLGMTSSMEEILPHAIRASAENTGQIDKSLAQIEKLKNPMEVQLPHPSIVQIIGNPTDLDNHRHIA